MPDKITLKAARVNAGLTLKEAAFKLGINESTLVRWEKRPEIVKPMYHSLISKVYGYSMDYILFNR